MSNLISYISALVIILGIIALSRRTGADYVRSWLSVAVNSAGFGLVYAILWAVYGFTFDAGIRQLCWWGGATSALVAYKLFTKPPTRRSAAESPEVPSPTPPTPGWSQPPTKLENSNENYR